MTATWSYRHPPAGPRGGLGAQEVVDGGLLDGVLREVV